MPSPDPKEEKAQAVALEEIGDPEFQALLKSLKEAVMGKPR